MQISEFAYFSSKWALLAFSGARKWDFERPNQKTETTFSREHPPKMVD